MKGPFRLILQEEGSGHFRDKATRCSIAGEDSVDIHRWYIHKEYYVIDDDIMATLQVRLRTPDSFIRQGCSCGKQALSRSLD